MIIGIIAVIAWS